MPNMDPLVRQQGLAFQQSELLREQFMKFAEALQKLHAGLEEVREDMHTDRQERLHEKDTVASAISSLRNEVHGHIEERLSLLNEEVTMRSRSTEGELQRLGGCLDSIAQQLGAQLMAVAEDQRALSENVHARITEFQNSFSGSAASRAMLEDLGTQVEGKIQGALQTGAAALREREEVLAEKIANVQSEAACEAEQWQERFNSVEQASRQLCTEMAAEHQQTRISAIGLATELSEIREAMAKESQSYQESTTSVQRWITETVSLRKSLQEEEIAHAALNNKVAEHDGELKRQVGVSKGLADATAEFKTGKEELWQMVTTSQDSHEQTVKDIQELRLRTQHMEVQRFGQVARQLEELSVQHSAAASKIEEIEHSHAHGQKALASKLDSHAQNLLQAQQEIKHLTEQSVQHDFIESRDQQYRLYVTMDGDIGIFRRSGWGKHGGDFAGVPRWHAGAIGEKALCSVNRETQAYEKDRFLAMANRLDAQR
ncbi:unnamed protein product [Symbiodinium pilosum]|uniref:Uncharacterized protein n=1 Tax=Symbiodinium pilosum TaxID=2952 RepID=A0A812T7V9_SYMPI|nr:unnamed protein product [Symbiodinium pilosum]